MTDHDFSCYRHGCSAWMLGRTGQVRNSEALSLPVLGLGDTLPTLVLNQPDGRQILLGEKSFIGSPVVLWIQGSSPQPILAHSLARKVDEFRQIGALVYAVASSDSGLPAHIPVLNDPENTIANALQLDSSGIAIFDRDFIRFHT